MKIEPRTLKGFRDFLPGEAKKRQYVINTLKEVFSEFGFEPLETPALEYEDILLGKYGEEGDKLLYRFTDNGDRRVALRYDQTVPLARVVAQYAPRGDAGQNEISFPFKRYQIQPVWRAENTQKGRFREFLQCDADIIGADTALADAEIIALAVTSLKKLGFENFKVLINDRESLQFSANGIQFAPEQNLQIVRAIDKLKKIGKEGVIAELQEKGFTVSEISSVFETIETAIPSVRLTEVLQILETLKIESKYVEFSPTLARGLDYYTGLIMEAEIAEYPAGSVLGGGRYNKLIGMFSGNDIAAVGFAFGFDRLLEALNELNLFPRELASTQVLVTIFSPELLNKSLEIVSLLRTNNISTELYLDENAKMDKQLKYADKKQIPYVVIIGPEEAENGEVALKNLKTREQNRIPKETLPNAIS